MGNSASTQTIDNIDFSANQPLSPPIPIPILIEKKIN